MEKSKKILIIKLSALGDVLASSPFFRLLKRSHSKIKIHHMVMTHCVAATINNPFVDKHIIIDPILPGKYFTNSCLLLKAGWQIYKEHYDVVFILHRHPLLNLLCRLIGIREIHGFANKKTNRLTTAISFSMEGNRTLQEYRLFAKSGWLTQPPECLEYYPLMPSPAWIESLDLPKRFIALNPGGGNLYAPADNKLWPLSSFIALINQLPLPVILLGHGQADELRGKVIEQATLSSQIKNYIGQFHLHETAYILQKSELFVGNDSALMYLAAALNRKTLGLYGPTSPDNFLPLGKYQQFIKSDFSCSPCYDSRHGLHSIMYKCQNNQCMQSISIYSVLMSIINLVNLNGDGGQFGDKNP